MKELLARVDLILMEAAIVEPLRRGGKVDLHPTLVNAALVYEDSGRQELQSLYRSYIEVAIQAQCQGSGNGRCRHHQQVGAGALAR